MVEIKISKVPHQYRNKYLQNKAVVSSSGSSIGGSGGSDESSSIPIIKTIDIDVEPTDSNVYSALKVDELLDTKLDKETWDSAFYLKDGNIHAKLNLIGEKEVSAFGVGESGGGGGLITIVDNLTSTSKEAALSANMGRELKDLIDGKVSVVSWNDIIGKPSTFIPTSHTHTFTSLTSKPTTLNGYGITDGVLKEDFVIHTNNTTVHITSAERTAWNDANSKKHLHSNKTLIDGITSALITNWNTAFTHISDSVKHITVGERTAWNAKLDKSIWDKAFYFDANGNLRVKVNLVGEKEVSAFGAGESGGGGGLITIVDNLTSTSKDAALSANMGRELKSLIDGKVSVVNWNDITGKPSSFIPSAHTHNYAGSSSAGGSATTAIALTSSAGSVTQPIYFSGGKPAVCTHTLGKSVPSNAVFTDTVYSLPTASASVLGGVKVGSGLAITSGVLSATYSYNLPLATSSVRGGAKIGFATSAANRNYGVQLSSEQMFVNVPWTDTVYTHPTQTAISVANANGRVLSGITVNTLGHTTACTYKTLAADDIPTLAISKVTDLQTTLDNKYSRSNTNIGTGATNYAAGNTQITAVSLSASTLTLTRGAGNLTASIPTWNQNTTGNAASATKLITSRTLWGKSFDGTSNISGDMTSVGNINIPNDNSFLTFYGGSRFGKKSGEGLVIETGTNYAVKYSFASNGLYSTSLINLGTSSARWNGIYGNTLSLAGAASGKSIEMFADSTYGKIQTRGGIPLTINPEGNNVGIGTASPSYKLDVAGTFRATGYGLFGNTGRSVSNTDGITIGAGDSSSRYITCYGKTGASYINFGYAASNNNCGELSFNYVGAGSTSNEWRIGFYGGGTGILSSTKEGNLSYNGNIISTGTITGSKIISNVSTGTSPLTVASTTMVTNLNSDMLDGLHSSSFVKRVGRTSDAVDFNNLKEADIREIRTTEVTTTNSPFSGFGVLANLLCGAGNGRMQLAGASSGNKFWFRAQQASASSPTNATWKEVVLSDGGSYNLNTSSATKLANTRTIWGQNFDGTSNISGDISGIGNLIFSSGSQVIQSGTNLAVEVNGGNYIFRNTDFKPYDSKTGTLNLGTSSARWNGIYGNTLSLTGALSGATTGAFSSNVTIGGNLGIGTASPTQKLHVAGNILATGEITAYSDARLKTDIKTLPNRGYLQPKTYIKDGTEQIGFIAQEVQELYPELVKDGEYLSLNYGGITAVLGSQLLELKETVSKLQDEIKQLKELMQ